jgi:hypothetical protein
MTLPLAGLSDRVRDNDRVGDDTVSDPDLLVASVEPEIRIAPGERLRPERLHDPVELFADARDLALRDPRKAHGLEEVVHLPRA